MISFSFWFNDLEGTVSVVKESQHVKIRQDASNFLSILEFKGLLIQNHFRDKLPKNTCEVT